MKTALVICALAALLLQQTTAQTQNDPPEQTLVDFFGEIGEQLVQTFQNATSSEDEEFAATIKNATTEFLQDVLLLTEPTDADRSIVENLQTFKKDIKIFRMTLAFEVKQLQSNGKRIVLSRLVHHLKSLDENVQNMYGLIHNIREQLLEDIVNTQTEIQQSWNIWASQQIGRAADATNGNEAAINEVEIIVNEHVNRYSTLVNGCADDNEWAVRDYEQSVQRVLDIYVVVLQSALTATGNCMEDDVTAAQCARNIKKETNELRKGSAEFVQLQLTGATFLRSSLRSTSCVVQTLLEFHVGTFIVERKIDVVVSSANAQRGSNESGSDDSESNGSSSDESNSTDSGSDDSESDDSESNGSNSDESDSAESSSDASDSDASGSDESNSDTSDSDESGSAESSSDASGADENNSISSD